MVLLLLFAHSHSFSIALVVGIAFTVLSSITVMGLGIAGNRVSTQHNNLPLETYDKSALSAYIKQITLHIIKAEHLILHQIYIKQQYLLHQTCIKAEHLILIMHQVYIKQHRLQHCKAAIIWLMTILYSVHHIQNTNKIIPQPPWRAGHWATHLNVYDPNDDFYDCLCGYNRRCKAIVCPMGIPAGNVLVYSHILGLKSDISPAGQPSKPTEQLGESRNQNHSKSEPDGSSNDGTYNDGSPNDGRYNDGRNDHRDETYTKKRKN